MTARSWARAAALLALLVGVAAPAGCASRSSPRAPAATAQSGVVPEEGRDLVVAYGCGSCHRIPGIPNAVSLVGPPLDGWSQRSFIAGTLTNDAEHLARWIEDPQGVRPGSAMPYLGISPEEADRIAAYLLTLR